LNWLEDDYVAKLDIWTSASVKPDHSFTDGFHIDNELAKTMVDKSQFG
jgi:hypothetical protein